MVFRIFLLATGLKKIVAIGVALVFIIKELDPALDVKKCIFSDGDTKFRGFWAILAALYELLKNL